ncbi:hypothetical protein [Pectinatus brassicae]|nr:hypothetical protein [Pectinatus brassicae]
MNLSDIQINMSRCRPNMGQKADNYPTGIVIYLQKVNSLEDFCISIRH